jgi:electron transport complex protein RnfD
MEQSKFKVSVSPHIRFPEGISQIMWWVNAALFPAAIASIYIFGLRSLLVIATSIASCVLVEALSQKAFRKEITISDGSAFLTGLLLSFNLPPRVPLWIPLIGSVIAIFLVKQLFGGLGYNIFNPALAARAVLLSSWPAQMTSWVKPVNGFRIADAVSSASPLGIVKEAARAGREVTQHFSYMDMFLGNIPGSLGETCKAALLFGAVVLIIKGIVDWRTPLSFIATVAVLSIPFGRNPLSEVLSGGLILGSFFMATDMVTAPTTRKGKIIFGAGCGIITALIRSHGGFPEGVCYSILFMNCLTPLIERTIRPRIFGTRRAEE